MKTILSFCVVLLAVSVNGQSPVAWNINSSYTHPSLVIDGTTTYISLKDVPSGISITSNSYWSTLDSLAPSSAPPGSDSLTSPDTSEIEGLTVPPSVTHDNFYFGFSHINEPGASDYLLNSVGIKEYSEWQTPPLTYYGPSANGGQSTLTYKFEFSGSIISAKARVNLSVWNFNVPGAFGSGQGAASAWASTDGQEWVNLINLPVPQTFSSGQTFEDMLPESVLGTKEIYLQIRMEVSGAPNSSYTTAQFGRSDANALKDIFYLDANYTSSVSHSDGLIAYYPFDGNASDMSDNNNHGVVYGASLSEDRYGRLGHAYNFDGDDWIELPHEKLLDGQSNVTIAAWYKFNSGAGEGHIISSGDSRGGNDPIHLRVGPSGSTQFSLHKISTPYTYSSMNSSWYHLASVLKSDKSSSELTVFINGEKIASSEKTLQVIYYDINMPTVIGALEGRPFYSSPGQFFNGSIDDVRVYNRALTSAEIDELYEFEKPFDPNQGLVAYFPFDGNASDMSGNGNHGTVYGATLSTDRNGDASKAYTFDGVNDYIQVGGPSSLTNGVDQTIAFWVKGTGLVYWNDDTQPGGDTRFTIRNDGRLNFWPNNDWNLILTDQSIETSSWHHIAITMKNGNRYRLFYDGALFFNVDDTRIYNHDDRTGIYIGSGHPGAGQGFFNGSIDEVRHYVRTLSDREVAALYELEKPFFDFAHCMEKLPGGSLIAIPKGYAAPGGLTLKSRGEGYDLYEVTGMVTTIEQTIETGKSLGRFEGKSEVLAKPSAYGLFTESDLSTTREDAWSEGQKIGRSFGELSVMNQPGSFGLFTESDLNSTRDNALSEGQKIGRTFGELSVINQPGSFGLKSEADFNSAKSNALIEGHSEILGKVVNIVKSIADTNELDIPDSLRNHSYSDFVDENGTVYLDEIEFAIAQFIDSADSSTTSPYTNGWFYSRNLGWMWTDKTVFPYFFRKEGWIYFKKGHNQPTFYNYKTKKWFDVKE